MKVLEVITSLDVGGAERALAARLEFQPEGVETVVLHGPPRTSQQVVLPERARSIELPLSRKALKRAIRSESPDVVVIHNPLNMIRYPKSAVTQEAPRVVYVAHAAVVSEKSWKALLLAIPFRLSLSKATKILAVSRQAGTQVGPRRNFEVLHLGSALSTQPLEESQRDNFEWLQEAGTRLLVLSRLSKAKNLPSLLAAIAQARDTLSEARVRLLIVGDGPDRAGLLRRTDNLGIGDLVRFSPTTQAPTEFLRHADFLVIPSSSEGGPLTAFEALLAGTDVIATPVGVIPDLAAKFPARFTVSNGASPHQLLEAVNLAFQRRQTRSNEQPVDPETITALETSGCAGVFYELITVIATR